MTPRVRFAFLCRSAWSTLFPVLRDVNPARSNDASARRRGAGGGHWPGLTWLLRISAIELAIKAETSVMLPGTIIVLLVLASDW